LRCLTAANCSTTARAFSPALSHPGAKAVFVTEKSTPVDLPRLPLSSRGFN
jgi:hypothetical protein